MDIDPQRPTPMADDIDQEPPSFDTVDQSVGDARQRVLWHDSPGQVLNLSTFALCGAAIAILWTIMPGQLAFYGSITVAILGGIEWARLYYTRYELTQDRLTKRWGLMTTHLSRVPLYRIEDSGSTSPFLMRLFGRGVVTVVSSDRSDPRLYLRAVRNPERLEDFLRHTYEAARARKGTRVIE